MRSDDVRRDDSGSDRRHSEGGTPGCELGMKPFVTLGLGKGGDAHMTAKGGIVENLLGSVKGYQGSRGRSS